jgi:hypothetical protein
MPRLARSDRPRRRNFPPAGSVNGGQRSRLRSLERSRGRCIVAPEILTTTRREPHPA